MFTVNHTPTFTVKVNILVPVDGGHDTQSIDVTYRALSDDEIDSFDMFTTEGQKDFLRAAIEKFADLVDTDKNPVPYNDAIRDQILSMQYARGPLMKGYSDAMVPALAGN